jgi:DNA processing protein
MPGESGLFGGYWGKSGHFETVWNAAFVIVIEAAARSGSLITARLAGEQGRDVFAVPGSPLDPRCEGTNHLIKNGAALLTSAADVIESLQSVSGRPGNAVFLEPGPEPVDFDPSDQERTRIASLLSHSPVAIDDLIRESGAPAPAVIAVVLELELSGKAVRHSGQLISLIWLIVSIIDMSGSTCLAIVYAS